MAAVLATTLALLVASSEAQSASEHIWGSVGWVLHGERTPLWGPQPEPALTPLGAQQMFEQGSVLRARYLNKNVSVADVSYAPIVGISANAIDNSQLSILTNTDQFMVTSSQAFVQGLYPPITQAFAENNGGIEAAMFPNGTIANYPLGGYQYPSIRTASVLDFESIWVGGHVGCTAYTESLMTFRNDTIVDLTYNNTRNFYANLWRTVLHEAFPASMANFANAYLLYDYASFRYNHDNQTHGNITQGEIAMMGRFASTEQRNKNANLSVSGNTEGDMIRAVAGRTMAAKTVELIRENIRRGAGSNKLNLVFTSLEPFVAFFALSGLIIGDSSQEFKNLPEPGAMMLFELFSIGGNETQYPELDDLWVRFLYRNGTDQGDKLTTYPLFDTGESRIPLTKFINAMQKFDVGTISGWCNLCNSVSLFCQDLRSDSSGSGSYGSGKGSGVDPTVAGAIGAAVTLAVAGLLFLIAVLLGSIRFHRPGSDSKVRNGTLGGFKGAEKMASDTDLAFHKGGARHERTGSWELRGGGKAGRKETDVEGQESVSPSTAGVTVRARDLTHPKDIDDDAISEYGQTPVKPREF